MKKLPLSLILLLSLAAPFARADLVGLYTFDGANPLEAVIGSPAKEGVMSSNNTQPVLSDTMSTIALVNDATVLGARTGVVAVPSKSTLAIPNPGLAKDWTIVLPFYCPANATWRCFFKFENNANGDGSLFIHNNTDIGASQYTTGLSGIVGAWHQLTVSSANGTQTVWYDQTKLGQTRNWNIAGLSLLLFSFDNAEEDALMYLDDIRLYDETAPADVFPDGTSGSPTIFRRSHSTRRRNAIPQSFMMRRKTPKTLPVTLKFMSGNSCFIKYNYYLCSATINHHESWKRNPTTRSTRSRSDTSIK